MNNDDFLLDVFEVRDKDESWDKYQDSFLAISEKEIGQEITLSSSVSASTTVELAFTQERHKLTVHLD